MCYQHTPIRHMPSLSIICSKGARREFSGAKGREIADDSGEQMLHRSIAQSHGDGRGEYIRQEVAELRDHIIQLGGEGWGEREGGRGRADGDDESDNVEARELRRQIAHLVVARSLQKHQADELREQLEEMLDRGSNDESPRSSAFSSPDIEKKVADEQGMRNTNPSVEARQGRQKESYPRREGIAFSRRRSNDLHQSYNYTGLGESCITHDLLKEEDLSLAIREKECKFDVQGHAGSERESQRQIEGDLESAEVKELSELVRVLEAEISQQRDAMMTYDDIVCSVDSLQSQGKRGGGGGGEEVMHLYRTKECIYTAQD
eukprot:CAMPEP_0173127770 /NCGR_PEP_ID=MMETSP1102-20130122/58053_1 /TAXON_ID=49646 /ORGANISM="Geminigera sp., Strain Caron Lab Isolate" /LENGTH=318 /DNA_ID=CAMNT_0014037579 /DNA_START=181 /DNA_END=1138 /DNA_ORIENTATION=+